MKEIYPDKYLRDSEENILSLEPSVWNLFVPPLDPIQGYRLSGSDKIMYISLKRDLKDAI
jgi:hypothetical protein